MIILLIISIQNVSRRIDGKNIKNNLLDDNYNGGNYFVNHFLVLYYPIPKRYRPIYGTWKIKKMVYR